MASLNASAIERLRRMLFGAKTEKTEEVLAQAPPHTEAARAEVPEDQPVARAGPRGHGRNGAAA